jgi:hypothetical protein
VAGRNALLGEVRLSVRVPAQEDASMNTRDQRELVYPSAVVNSRIVGEPEVGQKRGCRKQRTRFCADDRLVGNLTTTLEEESEPS